MAAEMDLGAANGRLGLAPDELAGEEDGRLGVVERRLLERGKKEHRETTQATQRALQIAEQTAEMGQATLVEIQRQGVALDKTDHALETVEKDVKEASRVMRFMRRWCCFQIICCCDCFDPTAADERTRAKRVKQRHQEAVALGEQFAGTLAAQQAGVARLATKGDPAFDGNEAKARSELFAASVRRKTSAQEETAPGLGYGLPETDRMELQEETAVQDRNLDRIGTTVDRLRVMSLELQSELESQAPQIESMGDRVHAAHDTLNMLAKEARRV